MRGAGPFAPTPPVIHDCAKRQEMSTSKRLKTVNRRRGLRARKFPVRVKLSMKNFLSRFSGEEVSGMS